MKKAENHIIEVNVLDIIPTPIISSRSVVHNFLACLKENQGFSKIIFNFSNVEFLSRSAAHELVKIKTRRKNIYYIGLSEELAEILRIVAANKIYPKDKPESLKLRKTTLAELVG